MVTFRENETEMICSFAGILNTTNCLTFEKELLEKTIPPKKVVFDLKQVSYVSSSFLRICVQLFHAKGKGGITVINLSPEVKKVFKISGIDELFEAV